ncbi:MAG: hypothetical protein K0U98_10730 [Deltaproteobacteria bacterium]|nr:hypothetical protein [Deltaproteobacteria bacterium]
MKNFETKPLKTNLPYLSLAFLILLLPSFAASGGDCEGILEIVFPQWIHGTAGLTCCSDPKGYDEDGNPDENVPSNPPGDGMWEKASNLANCGDCEVITTYKIFNEDGEEVGSGPTPPDSHAADESFHRI